MKYIIYILFFVCFGLSIKAQVPTGFPSQRWAGWIEPTYVVPDSGTIITKRDTSFIPRFVGTTVTWQRPGIDTTFWFWNGVHWGRVTLAQLDTTSLSNRINLKLNISDTTGKWLAQTSRLVDTVYRVNDSTVGYTIKGQARTFQILGRLPSGGTGTLTSVGLSMPAAFSVSGSPLTGAGGTINVSGAGISSQYIRGDGTLAAMDTSAIPNFFSKVRSEFSGTSPITYNSTTGIFGILNANASGQKGAATFNNSDFTDNGSALISLAPIGSGGSCLNCQLTIDTKGRITSFADGSIFLLSNAPGAGDTLVVSGDTIKRIYASYGLISTPTASSIALRVDTTLIQKLITANNGLTKIGNNIQLGGPLVQTTNIAVGTNELDIIAANGTNSTTRFTIDNTNAIMSGRYEDFSNINTIYANQDHLQLISTQPTGARRILIDSTTGIQIGENVSGIYQGLIIKKTSSQAQFNGYIGTNFQTIDTSFNSLVIDGSGNIFKRAGGNITRVTDWCNIVSAGADSTGHIDASSIINSLVNSPCRVIYIPAGNFLLNSTVQGKDSLTIIGDGTTSVLKVNGNFPAIRLGGPAKGGKYSNLYNFSILGTYNGDSTAGQTLQDGVLLDTAYNCYINNITAYKISGYGIRSRQAGKLYGSQGSIIESCMADSCFGGFKTDSTSEFNLFDNCKTRNTHIGFFAAAGTTRIVEGVGVHDDYGLYLTGGANNGHATVIGGTYAHNNIDGVHLTGVTNGENFVGVTIRQNNVHDIYMENSDVVWFMNCDLGVDSIVSINCTNSALMDNKYWNPITGRPGPPDNTLFRVVGDSLTVTGSAYLKNAFSLYDAVDNKRFDIKHINNVVDLITTNTGKIRTSDSLVVPVISGSETSGNNLKLYSTSGSGKGKIYLGDSSVYDEVNFRIGINNVNPSYPLHLFRTSGTNAIQMTDNGPTSLQFIRMTNDIGDVAQMFFGGSGAAPFVPNGGFVIDGKNYFGLVSENGQISFGRSTTLNGFSEHARFFNNGHFAMGSIIDNGHKLQVVGAVTINKDSVPIITSPTTQMVVLIDTANNNQLERATASVFGNTLYTGDGTANNRTVTVTGSTMTFTSALSSPTPTLTVNNTSSGHGVLGSASGAGYGVYGSGFRGVYGTGTGGGTGVYGQETSGIGVRSVVTTGTSLEVDHTPTSFNDVQQGILISRTTSGNSGNGANGIGTYIAFAAPTTTTTSASIGGTLNWYWSTATNASRSGAFKLQTVTNAGSLTDKMIVGDNFTLNTTTAVWQKVDGTVPYTSAIGLTSANNWQFGYTPTPNVFSKGNGITIDTNNNVSLGQGILSSSAPLYATGGSTLATGFQSSQGNFFVVSTITAGTTSISNQNYFVQCDASGGNVIINLPAASTVFGASMGVKYVFFRTDATGNTVTINRAGSDTINGATSFTLTTQYQTKQLQCTSASTWAQY